MHTYEVPGILHLILYLVYFARYTRVSVAVPCRVPGIYLLPLYIYIFICVLSVPLLSYTFMYVSTVPEHCL